MSDNVRSIRTPAGDPAWLVTGYELCRAALNDPRLGRSHPEPSEASQYSQSVIFSEPPQSFDEEAATHREMRRMLTPSFSSRRMTELAPRVSRIVDGLLDDLERQGPPADIHKVLSFPLPALVICEILGVPSEDRDRFGEWSNALANIYDPAVSQGGLASLVRYLEELLPTKLENPEDDVLSDLLEMHRADPVRVPLERVTSLALALLFAGHETVVGTIDKGVVFYSRQPGQAHDIVTDPARLTRFVEEILRCPVQRNTALPPDVGTGNPRYASADMTVDGQPVKHGDLVVIDLEAGNTDPDVYTEPERFDADRTGVAPHLSFGHGRYFCIGAPLARLELETVFVELVKRFPGLELAEPDDIAPRSKLLTANFDRLLVSW